MTMTITITATRTRPPQKDHDAGPVGAYEVLEEAVRSLLIEKGVLTAQEIAAQVDLMDSRSPALGAKVVARAWVDPAFKKRLLDGHARGAAPSSASTSARWPSSARWRTRHRCTTSSSARCAPATRRCCWAFRRPGTRAWPTARAPSSIRAACWPSSASSCPRASRCACTIPPPTCATSCCRCAPRARKDWSEEELAALVTRDSMIGTAIPVAPAKPAGTRRKKAA